jgi:hypothetical protein
MFATNVDNFSISSGVIERDATWLFLSISIAVFPFVAIAVLKVINRALLQQAAKTQISLLTVRLGILVESSKRYT